MSMSSLRDAGTPRGRCSLPDARTPRERRQECLRPQTPRRGGTNVTPCATRSARLGNAARGQKVFCRRCRGWTQMKAPSGLPQKKPRAEARGMRTKRKSLVKATLFPRRTDATGAGSPRRGLSDFPSCPRFPPGVSKRDASDGGFSKRGRIFKSPEGAKLVSVGQANSFAQPYENHTEKMRSAGARLRERSNAGKISRRFRGLTQKTPRRGGTSVTPCAHRPRLKGATARSARRLAARRSREGSCAFQARVLFVSPCPKRRSAAWGYSCSAFHADSSRERLGAKTSTSSLRGAGTKAGMPSPPRVAAKNHAFASRLKDARQTSAWRLKSSA